MDIPWPKLGDRLIKRGGHGPLWAHTLSHQPDIGLIATGFKSAGDALVERLAKQGRDDALTLPVLFCYRQYIELRLKEVIEKINTFEETGETYKQTHKLSQLWSTLKTIMTIHIENKEQQEFDIVEECIMELHNLDEKGIAFRYPVIFFQEQIDIGNMKSVMDAISSFLDAIADQWDEGIHNKF